MNANKESAIEALLDANLRFARKKEIIPNIELKVCKKEIDFLTLEEKVKVIFPKIYIYFYFSA